METASKVTTRYTDNGDGTITDSKTNLVWMKEDDGKERNWNDAKKYCEDNDAKLPGKEWRMPTREELLTIIDLERYRPAADPIFNAKSDWYWSSTPFAFGSGSAWCVGFSSGYVGWGNLVDVGLVRPVRQNS